MQESTRNQSPNRSDRAASPRPGKPGEWAEQLRAIGQSIWLDDITRELLDSGALAKYVEQWPLTGLTSNPTIFDHAISHGAAYDREIARLVGEGKRGEELFFELAIQDLVRAAEIFQPVHRRTATVDGWVSLEVSPLLAHDTQRTVAAAQALSAKANKPNLFIKIPGTKEGLPAIEEAIFHGVPVNVTLLFSPDQYTAAADAYLRGLERRVKAGLSPDIRSVASVFISRWDVAVAATVPDALKNRLGIAIGELSYKAYRDLLETDRWQRLANLGARAQRLLFASTGTKDPKAPDVLYVISLTAPNTVNTVPEATLKAAADHAFISHELSRDGGDGAELLQSFEKAGVRIAALAEKLQSDGTESFVKSWRDLLKTIDSKIEARSRSHA
ncbi:MAG TPA: transaldolase [Stellaceae bacterium]|nr:transaldolase [Stellaceae bacterium]